MTTTEYPPFNELQLSFLQKPMESLYVADQYDEVAEEEGTSKKDIGVFVDAFEKNI